jgi:hypothetical protein
MRKINELEMVKIGLAENMFFDLPVADMNQLEVQQEETVFPVERAPYYNNGTRSEHVLATALVRIQLGL